MFLAIYSLAACSIARPRGLICIAHLESATIPVAYNHCYDMEKDFDDKGNMIPGHNGVDIPLSLDKHVNMDQESFASLSAYWQKLVKRYENCQAGAK